MHVPSTKFTYPQIPDLGKTRITVSEMTATSSSMVVNSRNSVWLIYAVGKLQASSESSAGGWILLKLETAWELNLAVFSVD